MMEPDKIQGELDKLWNQYKSIIDKKNPTWPEINKARSILYLTGNLFCEEIAVTAIERRLHLLKEKLSLIEFFNLIDTKSEKLKELRKDDLFVKLESFYNIIKKFKNNYTGGKYYLEEEKFIKLYNEINPNKDLKMGYKGSFNKKQ